MFKNKKRTDVLAGFSLANKHTNMDPINVKKSAKKKKRQLVARQTADGSGKYKK